MVKLYIMWTRASYDFDEKIGDLLNPPNTHLFVILIYLFIVEIRYNIKLILQYFFDFLPLENWIDIVCDSSLSIHSRNVHKYEGGFLNFLLFKNNV